MLYIQELREFLACRGGSDPSGALPDSHHISQHLLAQLCELPLSCSSVLTLMNFIHLLFLLGDHLALHHGLVDACSVGSDSATPWPIAHQFPPSLGILQAGILEWIVMPSSRGSSQPRDRTQVSCFSCIGRQILCCCATWEAQFLITVFIYSFI